VIWIVERAYESTSATALTIRVPGTLNHESLWHRFHERAKAQETAHVPKLYIR
jgi:hypothetical protein